METSGLWKKDVVAEEFVAAVGRRGATASVSLCGEADVLTVEKVRAALGEALAGGPAEIVVDLTQLEFIDSTGLGALVFGFQRAREVGVRFSLASPTPAVRQILMLSGVLEVIELTP